MVNTASAVQHCPGFDNNSVSRVGSDSTRKNYIPAVYHRREIYYSEIRTRQNSCKCNRNYPEARHSPQL